MRPASTGTMFADNDWPESHVAQPTSREGPQATRWRWGSRAQGRHPVHPRACFSPREMPRPRLPIRRPEESGNSKRQLFLLAGWGQGLRRALPLRAPRGAGVTRCPHYTEESGHLDTPTPGLLPQPPHPSTCWAEASPCPIGPVRAAPSWPTEKGHPLHPSPGATCPSLPLPLSLLKLRH